MRTGGSGGHDATDGRGRRVRRFQRQPATLGGETAIDFRPTHPGLDTHPILHDLPDPMHVAREIDYEARPERRTSSPRAPAARREWNGALRGIADHRLHIAFVLRPHHAEGTHLEWAGIGRV